MVVQGSPIIWQAIHYLTARLCNKSGLVRLAMCAALFAGHGTAVDAAEKTVRLRLAWGSDTSAKARWTGQITVAEGVLTDLQPLGIEADAPVALRIDGSRLVVAPLERRGFDGCDLTVRADEQALVSLWLKSGQSPEPTRVEVPLAEILASDFRQPLDEFGSYFLAHRAPGDKLRIRPTRDSYVFAPGESWTLSLEPDLESELAAGPLELDMVLRAAGEEEILWQTSQQVTTESSTESTIEAGLNFEIESPAIEKAYRLTITARRQEGLATRFVPGRQAKVLVQREVEFVVIDPSAKLSQLVDRWQPVLTIDPANPRWWQRLPTWTQVPGLREKTRASLGNIRPVVRSAPAGDLVELPEAAQDAEPYWQSYTLPVREPGAMHLIEIEYPLAAEQHLTISVIEPDAAGRVMAVNQDSGFYSAGASSLQDGKVGRHRFVFWPRTSTPQLLLVNRHPSQPAQFGKIKLYRQDASQTAPPLPMSNSRMVAGYLSRPTFAANFGANEVLDPASGLSLQGWSTFLEGAQRLVQFLRLNGQNTLLLSVAADGSALYPSRILNPSPRYDTGLMAATGQDPCRKDVLEMLLRILDREGIQLIPTIQLATPLPHLEQERLAENSQLSGVGWVGRKGQTWLTQYGTVDGLAPYYNPLNARVQTEVNACITELTDRYGQHAALAGIGIQVAGNGYGVLPELSWGMDDATVAKFARDAGIQIPGEGPQRFEQRAEKLLGEYRSQWMQWRARQLGKFYARLADSLTSQRSDLQLFLATESLFAGKTLSQRLRQSLASPTNLNQLLMERGIDLTALHATPGISALSPLRQSAGAGLQQRALDLRIGTANKRGELFAAEQNVPQLLYHATDRFYLPSFDQRSPFGAEQTHLLLTRQGIAAGAAQRKQLVTRFSQQDAAGIFVGGEQMSLATHTQLREILHTIAQLPGPESAVRTLAKQPLVMRVFRTETATTIALVNESPWPVQVRLPFESSLQSSWQKLGTSSVDSQEQRGELPEGPQQWQVELLPYDLQAWRFETSKLRVGEPLTSQDDLVRIDLEQRIEQIEARTGNLDIERDYPQLQNPGFELQEGQLRIVGWQPFQGTVGSVQLDNLGAHQGENAVRLTSEDAVGVALQSNLFPMPETGQLVVSAFLRAEHWDPSARLHIAIEDSNGGRFYRQFAILGREKPISDQWAQYEFPVDDIPLNSKDQIRIQFLLTGSAEVLLDDVQLCDLRFDEGLRGALVKRIYAAKIALEQNHVVDCLQVVDEYWSRYLVEYVPPLETGVVREAKQPAAIESEAEQEESKGIRDRFKGWVPKIWR